MTERPKDKAIIFRRYTWKVFNVHENPEEFEKWLDNDPEIITTQWSSDFRTCAVIYIAEQKWISHKEKDDTLEYTNIAPDHWKEKELNQINNQAEILHDTPLGEALDDNPIEEDFTDNDSDQPSLFNEE